MKWTLLLLVLLSGCSARVQVSSGSPNSGVSVHADGGTALAALLGLAFIASAYRMENEPAASSRPAPELAPDRRISEQDCTKPIDYSLGNLRCK